MSTSAHRADECPRHDLPLHRIGVLELVDQHDRKARAKPPGRPPVPALGSRSTASQIGLQIVVAANAPQPLADGHLLAHRLGQPAPHARERIAQQPQPAPARLTAPGAPHPRRSARASIRRDVRCIVLRAGGGEFAEVQVFDNLGDQIVQRLDEPVSPRQRGQLGRHPEPGEHLGAELMGSGDGGRVEGSRAPG